MPGFCFETWGKCKEGGKHECDGIVVATKADSHRHKCGKCGEPG